jgi:hypothetical protein
MSDRNLYETILAGIKLTASPKIITYLSRLESAFLLTPSEKLKLVTEVFFKNLSKNEISMLTCVN